MKIFQKHGMNWVLFESIEEYLGYKRYLELIGETKFINLSDAGIRKNFENSPARILPREHEEHIRNYQQLLLDNKLF